MRDLDEADLAALSLGDAMRVESMLTEGERPRRRTQYRVRCVFCHRDHESDFWDEIDEGIMRCRDEAPVWKQARLDTFAPVDLPLTPAEWEREQQV